MEQKIIFQAKGGINEKSTVTITLFDKVDDGRPYVLQVNTYMYDKKQKEYLLGATTNKYFYNYDEALEDYIENLQFKITFGYSIRQFQAKPIIIS